MGTTTQEISIYTIQTKQPARVNRLYTFLETAEVYISDAVGNKWPIRVLLDTAASRSVISATSLNRGHWNYLKGRKSLISGVTSGTINTNKVIHTTVSSRLSNYKLYLEFMILPDFTNTLAKPRLTPLLKYIIDEYASELADSSILTDDDTLPFDAILGNDVLNLLDRTPVKAITSRLMLRRTPFGIVLSGPIEEMPGKKSNQKRWENNATIFLLTKRPPVKIPTIPLDSSPNPRLVTEVRTKTAQAALDRELSAIVREFYNREFEDFSAGLVSDTKLDEQADLFVTSALTRDNEGRYVTKLPWRTECMHMLSRNIGNAHRRWVSLMEKFETDLEMAKTYSKYIKAWIDQGVLVEVPDSTLEQKDPYTIIPHHVVIKATSAAHKYRVVCDAKAHEKDKLCANDCIAKGPNLLPDIFDILVRLRFGKIISFGDIEKAFLQVSLHPSERNRLFLFWSKWVSLGTNQSECTRVLYAFHRLPWGLNVSPYILLKVIRTHLRNNFSTDPASARLVENILLSLYMDDLVRTYDTTEECIQEISFAIRALLDAKFPLRKICSNSKHVWNYFSTNFPEHTAEPAVKLESRVLGTLYSAEDDYIRPDVGALQKTLSCNVPFLTKSLCLSAHSLVYDPLGLIEHWHFTAKRLMQETQFLGIDWDVPIPKALEREWFDWIESHVHMLKVRVPRFVAPVDPSETSYHIFVDASEIGYAACAYAVYNNQAALICSKARVVPKKFSAKVPGISIPRIELLGAELGTRLWERIRLARQLDNEKVRPTFWSDSQTALWWIRSLEGRYKIFVSNRVKAIRQISSPEQWRFVPGKQNPADLATRGMPAIEASSSKEWFHGPSWLVDPNLWPAPMEIPTSIREGEVERLNVLLTFSVPQGIAKFELLQQATSCSLWPTTRLTKIWGYVGRFIRAGPTVGKLASISRKSDFRHPQFKQNAAKLYEHYRRQFQQNGGTYTAADRRRFLGELRDAEARQKKLVIESDVVAYMHSSRDHQLILHYLIGESQQHYFPGYVEAISLSYNEKLDLPDKVRRPIIELGLEISDVSGLIVSQGRVRKNTRKLRRRQSFHPQEGLPDVTRELILIPPVGVISESIMYDAHLHTNHGGQLAMTHATRTEYWVLGASRVARSIKKACKLCKLFDSPAFSSEPGDLPFARFSPAYPFQHLGLDYAFLKCGYELADKTQGLVMCIFTCMVTRAVHFELSTNMSAAEFARVFETFCNSRSVIPETVVSDNGKNFSPIIKHLLKKWRDSTDPKYRKIIWKPLPKSAPDWGGFYERMIGVFKGRFVREFPKLAFSSLLEAHSALKRIESRMNQRPLGAVSMDRDDPEILTPASFLIVLPSGSEGQPSYENITGLAALYKSQQKAVDKLWYDFYLSYLSALRIHHKWTKQHIQQISVGDLVLLAADKIKARSKWPIGRVREIIYDTRQNKPKAAYVDVYSPTLGNLPLKNKLYGVRTPYKNLSVEQRNRVVGCFKKAQFSTPITQLYPYEMWRSPPVSLTLKKDEETNDEPPEKKPRIDNPADSTDKPQLLPDVVDEDCVEFIDEDGDLQQISASAIAALMIK